MPEFDFDKLVEAIARRVVEIQSEAAIAHPSAIQKPDAFLPPSEIPQWLPDLKTAEAVRNAARNGMFKSGTEARNINGRWKINPYAFDLRIGKEQQRRKVC